VLLSTPCAGHRQEQDLDFAACNGTGASSIDHFRLRSTRAIISASDILISSYRRRLQQRRESAAVAGHPLSIPFFERHPCLARTALAVGIRQTDGGHRAQGAGFRRDWSRVAERTGPRGIGEVGTPWGELIVGSTRRAGASGLAMTICSRSTPHKDSPARAHPCDAVRLSRCVRGCGASGNCIAPAIRGFATDPGHDMWANMGRNLACQPETPAALDGAPGFHLAAV